MTDAASVDKPGKRPVHGVLLLDKPLLLSSNSTLQKARWHFHAQKAGHTGVLDPMATGLLPVCFGEATKFSAFLLDADKGYTATLRLGQRRPPLILKVKLSMNVRLKSVGHS